MNRVLLLLVVLIACDARSVAPQQMFECGPHNSYSCTSGRSCIYGELRGRKFGVCAAPGEGPPDGAIVADLGTADLLPNPSGCADGRGHPIYPGDPNGERQWLCPTLIAAGEIFNKCAPGWQLCANGGLYTSGPYDCRTVTGGFFVANEISRVPAPPPPDAAAVCDTWENAPATEERFIHGCGISAAVFDFATKPCGGFRHAVNCKNGSKGLSPAWSCPASNPSKDSDLLKVTNSDPNSGVTCCKG